MGRWITRPPGKIKTRTCLKCDESFQSTGPFNRMCPACQYANSKKSEDFMTMSLSVRSPSSRKGRS